jgi:hypothetical protein
MEERLPPLPQQVRKRGGRLEPFAREKIQGALFAALASLGTPDAFLASELTDSVLHFLRQDESTDPLPTTHIAETLIKVVRELGYPGLAYRFDLSGRERRRLEPAAAVPPPLTTWTPAEQLGILDWVNTLPGPEVTRRCGSLALAQVIGSAIYPRHLWAAHTEQLLCLGGLTHPNRLAELTLRLSPQDPVGWLSHAGQLAGLRVHVEAGDIELGLASLPLEQVGELARQLHLTAEALGLQVAVHLNAPPPAWAQPSLGPLFPPDLYGVAEADSGGAAWRPWRLAWVEALKHLPPSRHTPFTSADEVPGLKVVWHVGSVSAAEEAAPELACLQARGWPVEVNFHRTRSPRPEGLAARAETSPAKLATYTLRLDTLRNRHQQRLVPEAFVGKVGSLTRLALSAGEALRQFLKQTATPWPAFLLEKAGIRLELAGLSELLPELADAWAVSLADAELLFHQHLARHLSPILRYAGAEVAPQPHVPAEDLAGHEAWTHAGRWLSIWGPSGTLHVHGPIDWEYCLPFLAGQTLIPRLSISPWRTRRQSSLAAPLSHAVPSQGRPTSDGSGYS